MSIKEKTYTELSLSVPSCISDIICEIIRDNYSAEGIVTSEEKYKNLECVCVDETIKAYLTDENLNLAEIKNFFKEKKQIFEDCGLIEKTPQEWTIALNTIENQDWSANWKKHWKPLKISDKIVICPTWEEYEAKQGEIKINLDPGNAFGTGTHATTQLCVVAMEKFMPLNADVADIGTGSGILSICARKLGAKSAIGIDIDDTVRDTAVLNAQKNGVPDIDFRVCEISQLQSEKYDFVFANILHNVLVEIMPELKRIAKSGAYIALSGILKEKQDVVLDAVKKCSLKIEEEIEQGDWIAFVVKKEK